MRNRCRADAQSGGAVFAGGRALGILVGSATSGKDECGGGSQPGQSEAARRA